MIYFSRNKYAQKHHHHHHQCRPTSIKNKNYNSDDDIFDHHRHHHHHTHQPPAYNTRSLRYGSYHANPKRSPSPSSRGAYSEYSTTANYEKMDDNYIDDDQNSDNQSPPPLPKKMRATAVSVSEGGEKVTHIWQMPLPVPGE